MVKIGVLGAGHLGKIHIKLVQQLNNAQFVGFYDPNSKNAEATAKEFNTTAYKSIDALIDACDAIDIVTPTLSHFECASKSLKKFKHIFIEKPITNTVKEAHELIKLVTEAKVKAQVGHVERFNPAFKAVQNDIHSPMFIETHRLAQFNPRSTDISVVLDLMIHDLDIVLSTVKSPVKRVSASGVPVISNTPDIANARIEFDNGCVANLTASRISLKNMRKTRFFQKNAYISVDFLDKKTEVVKMKDADTNTDPFAIVLDLGEGKAKKEIYFDKTDAEPTNAIQEELQAFIDSIINNTTPPVTVEEGAQALELAYQILEKINFNSGLVKTV